MPRRAKPLTDTELAARIRRLRHLHAAARDAAAEAEQVGAFILHEYRRRGIDTYVVDGVSWSIDEHTLTSDEDHGR